MNPLIPGTVIILIIGLIGAVLLVIASKFLAVKNDDRIEEIEAALPGANCGSCGYAGCSDYARAIVEDGAPGNQCSAGGITAAKKISIIMGTDVGSQTQYKAMIACQGDLDHTQKRYEYHGIESCAACNVLYNGNSSCPFGCLGFGDCAAACKFGAITINNGIAHVDPDKCTGCGVCKTVCPKRIIFLYRTNDRPKPIVMCSNHKKAPVTRRECTAGCIGCGKCVRNCPVSAVEVRNNVARIDFEKCVGCGKCATECPVNAIYFAGKKPSVKETAEKSAE